MEFALPALLWFDPARERERRAQARTDEKERLEKRLFCAACRRPVTHESERIRVQGAHEHTCVNPHGLTYRIACFREASCLAEAIATTGDTWFPGYAWSVALCRHCRAHLGWRFEAPGERFHGLIVGRLTSDGGRG